MSNIITFPYILRGGTEANTVKLCLSIYSLPQRKVYIVTTIPASSVTVLVW
jgi:hypothetical protein